MLWLWVLIAALVGGLALTVWGLWWLWHKVTALAAELERLLGRLEEAAQILEKVDLDPLDGAVSHPGGHDTAW
ncbi:Uncharacterised protein [Acidipropionibacterium jensenii]|uniref:Uncharacterized protein n=2 Tax=Acidipropionibacterium jensenii TaxID=1749 RepID=A0A3Q9URH7_9ACTN|nr:hypothetical protein [Acidipropionibacterium jensenii]MDN6556334.1 hypothetical protein [Acidipropionibacterium acidipropionici]AZZ40715.1 hypothetical protein C0Z10_05150 [Acidipropionibacterium jensenii]AZZ43347.1 hypothetical protein C0Z11_08715 [Acidipropionibacterium jensenii]MDN5977162.1 hypothetical protein [Acidipropionibacterium jensenii]MDN5996030.1 hypothetical protein [Acidipropionibacterium jensenii]